MRRAVALRPAPSVRLVVLAVVAATILAGWAARAFGHELGTETAPFFWIQYRAPPDRWWWPLPPLVAALAAAAALLRADDTLGARPMAAACFAIALVARAGLATARHGVAEWWWPFTRPGARTTEYAAAFPAVAGHPLRFLDRFAELVPTLPVHPSGHPAGATLLAWAIDRATGGVRGYAVALMVLGAAAAWPVLALGRRLVGEQAARRAVLLWAFAPSTLLYGATSFDGLLVLVAASTAAALLANRAVLGAAAALFGFLLSYALALAPLWAVLILGRRAGLRVAVVCAAVGLAGLGLLAAATGYDPVGALRATHAAYERGVGGTRRPWWFWAFGGPTAFLVMLGPVLAERVLRGVERGTAGARALAACVVLAAATTVSEAETERIWQFLVPFAAVAAAPLLSRRAVVLALLLAVLQAYVVELRWDTTW